MNRTSNSLQQMHESEGKEIIQKLKEKIDETKYNIEVSDEIINETPSDAQRAHLIEKNLKRHHAIASLNRELLDIEQTINKRSHEV